MTNSLSCHVTLRMRWLMMLISNATFSRVCMMVYNFSLCPIHTSTFRRWWIALLLLIISAKRWRPRRGGFRNRPLEVILICAPTHSKVSSKGTKDHLIGGIATRTSNVHHTSSRMTINVPSSRVASRHHDRQHLTTLPCLLTLEGGLYICLPSESNFPNLLDKPLKGFIVTHVYSPWKCFGSN